MARAGMAGGVMAWGVIAMGAVARLWAALRRGARLMIGVPDYDAYVAHWRRHHPDRPVPGYGDFFRMSEARRYGRSGKAPCC